MTAYAVRLENGDDTITRVRQSDTVGLFPAGPLKARSGVRNDGGGEVAIVSGAMQATVSPFSGWINGGSSALQGGYPFVSDAVVTLTFDDGDSASDRIDTVVARVDDDIYDGSGTTAASVVVVKGTAGSGVAPSLPPSCAPLRDVNIPAGASTGSGGLSSSNLGADRRPYVADGVMRLASATELSALVSPQKGQVVYQGDADALKVYDGTEWVAYKKDDGLLTQVGTVTTDSISNSGSWQQVAAVNFETAYSQNPSVFVQETTAHGGDPFEWGTVTFGPGQGFYVRVNAASAVGAQTLTWIAVGPA